MMIPPNHRTINLSYYALFVFLTVISSCQGGGSSGDEGGGSSQLSNVSLEGISAEALGKSLGQDCGYSGIEKSELARFLPTSTPNLSGCAAIAKLFTKARYSVTSKGNCSAFQNIVNKESDITGESSMSFQIISGCAYNIEMYVGAKELTSPHKITYFYHGKSSLSQEQSRAPVIPVSITLDLTQDGKKLWKLEDKIEIQGLSRKEPPGGSTPKLGESKKTEEEQITDVIKELKWDFKTNISNRFTIQYTWTAPNDGGYQEVNDFQELIPLANHNRTFFINWSQNSDFDYTQDSINDQLQMIEITFVDDVKARYLLLSFKKTNDLTFEFRSVNNGDGKNYKSDDFIDLRDETSTPILSQSITKSPQMDRWSYTNTHKKTQYDISKITKSPARFSFDSPHNQVHVQLKHAATIIANEFSQSDGAKHLP